LGFGRLARVEIGASQLHQDAVDGQRTIAVLGQAFVRVDRRLVLTVAGLGFRETELRHLPVQPGAGLIDDPLISGCRFLGVADRHERCGLAVARELAGVARRVLIRDRLELRRRRFELLALGRKAEAGGRRAGCGRGTDSRLAHDDGVGEQRSGAPFHTRTPREVADERD
jgi:hypothetical protein